ncbi:helix-turn-helix domain-containing protein [Bacteroides timonensis]|uniref:hypothetical protein n=1 Tax=Bacteroides timonensis TaxID=1470345 RepID=UPI0004ACD94C|nr:hypothetical protein [Bacteroides timonensis]
MKQHSVISADIVASTSLSPEELSELRNRIIRFIDYMEQEYNGYGRIIKGDYIECYCPSPEKALRLAIALKCCIKSYILLPENVRDNTEVKRRKLFKDYAVRVSVGIGDMKTVDIRNGILDGDAIYRAGRNLKDQNTSQKEKVIIKKSFFWTGDDKDKDMLCNAIGELIDNQLNRSTAKQCEVLYYKLIGKSENEISLITQLSQSTVNQHSTSIGSNAIIQAINYIENNTKLWK